MKEAKYEIYLEIFSFRYYIFLLRGKFWNAEDIPLSAMHLCRHLLLPLTGCEPDAALWEAYCGPPWQVTPFSWTCYSRTLQFHVLDTNKEIVLLLIISVLIFVKVKSSTTGSMVVVVAASFQSSRFLRTDLRIFSEKNCEFFSQKTATFTIRSRSC